MAHAFASSGQKIAERDRKSSGGQNLQAYRFRISIARVISV